MGMMHLAVRVLAAFFAAEMFAQASDTKKVISQYGENITVPCNGSDNKPADLIFTKWKYTRSDGTSGDLLVKQAQKDEAKISATDSYKDRVNITSDSSLVITRATLSDQITFTCMVVSFSNLNEYPVEVEVRKRPSAPELKNKASQLENGKPTPLGECVSTDANPPVEIIWLKNNQTLVDNGNTVVITTTETKDSVTGLSSSKSRLLYAAGKEDMTSKFACLVRHVTGPDQVTAPVAFSIYYPTEKVSLQVMPAGPVKEGDNVTLKCQADGNPPPTNFNFHIKGKKVTVTGSNVHVLSGVTRDDSGEYKCSLPNNDKMEATAMITVNYLDLSVSPSGRVLKKLGELLEVKVDKNVSSEPTVIWTKEGTRLEKQPNFTILTYSHAGVYTCEMSVGGIKRSSSFQLIVEGTPIINSLTKKRSTDGKNKVLTCEAEGSPQPDVQWSVNGTDSKSTYNNGKAIFTLTVEPRLNQTVACHVVNSLGSDSRTISVLPLIDETQAKQDQPDDDDKAKLIVGIVVGLIVVAALVGIIYWLYMKRRQGTWKTGEKEMGTSEESKKLEENSHRQEV
ncbi:CD166 antigen isoform X1 [Astyanax mexicanus]|uniref:CD166 antigen isoform X1 n=1 Tax=Astyanax mexicanus TaxID=7994 RepID=A0A8T2L3P3_ASTMX|nr:CD166 antigen isoform X1 [Astyanax mexicanus]